MDHTVRIQDFHLPNAYPSPSTSLAYGILALYVVHQALVYCDFPILSPQELLWNALVYVAPARLLLDSERRHELRENNIRSRMQAAKSEALRRLLGFGTGALTHKLVGGEGIMRRMSMLTSSDEPTTDAPPGLGNWDNSCYQNSVLQGLAALDMLKGYLGRSSTSATDAGSTSASLQETIATLNDTANNGKQLWTPAKLKSMSSWQQQDAQEYFSKIMDELDKEAARSVAKEKVKSGLESVMEASEAQTGEVNEGGKAKADSRSTLRNPLEGLLAQRVACIRCGFSEGLSMIPFNCLTVPLGSDFAYDLDDCLDEYTKLEEINDVDCPKCTLLRAEGQLRQMIPAVKQVGEDEKVTAPSAITLPPELRALATKRLQAIRNALDEDSFSDKTLNEVCQIPKMAHVSSTKTRQAVIGRAPQSLVVHVNRSVFDEMTGVQRKNYAKVRYPMVLDLGSWMLGDGLTGQATQSILADDKIADCLYRLKAVVTHYGRHENGHYICYRRHPLRHSADADDDAVDTPLPQREQWWRLSDEDVSAITEEDVLGQGGVFMLFYERHAPEKTRINESVSVDTAQADLAISESKKAAVGEAAATPLPMQDEQLDAPEDEKALRTTAAPPETAPASALQPPTEPAKDTEPEVIKNTDAEQPLIPARKLPSPPLMRTARGRQGPRQGSMGEKGFGNTLRAVTAS